MLRELGRSTLLAAVCCLSQRACQAADWTPGVNVGSGVFERTKWVDVKSVGQITSIFQPPTEPKRIGLGGRNGAAWIEPDGRLISTITLPPQRSFVEFVDLEADGTYEILDRGGHGWSPAEVYDSKGTKLWTYPKEGFNGNSAIDDLASGDLDGDGKPEFVAGYNGSDGLHRVDRLGTDVWQKEGGNIWHVEIVDLDGDGQKEIAHSGANGQLTIRDAAGAVKKHLSTGTRHIAWFSVMQSRDSGTKARLALAGDQQLLLVSGDGGQTAYPLNLASSRRIPSIAEVRWKKDGPLQIAVLLNTDRERVSALTIYDVAGQQVYEEVLNELCLAIRVLPDNEDGDRLLLGGLGQVWEYMPKK